jgi:hypothetical protein
MGDAELYGSIRAEILANHLLMHWFTMLVALAVLGGVWLIEKRETVLAVFIPLLSLSWAAAIVRFDFFIQRQGAYLRTLESQMQDGFPAPMWETWKMSLSATRFVVPTADIIASAVIVLPTIYLLFGPCQRYFKVKEWRMSKLYAWALSLLLLALLSSLSVIPRLASLGR